MSASRIIDATAEAAFDEIADPSRQPAWDGGDEAEAGQPSEWKAQVVLQAFTDRPSS